MSKRAVPALAIFVASFVLLLFVSGVAVANDAKVSITVMDGTSAASGATVTITDENGTEVATGTTGQDGKFKTRLPAGKYTITSEKDGKTSTETIDHGTRKTKVITFLSSGNQSQRDGIQIPSVTMVVPQEMGSTVVLDPGVDPVAFLADNNIEARPFLVPGDCPPESSRHDTLPSSSAGRFAAAGDAVSRAFTPISSHQDAPIIAIDPCPGVDDVYAFVAPNSIANGLANTPGVSGVESVICVEAQLPAAGTFAPFVKSQAAPRHSTRIVPVVVQSTELDVKVQNENGQAYESGELDLNLTFDDPPTNQLEERPSGTRARTPTDWGNLEYYNYTQYSVYPYNPEADTAVWVDTDQLEPRITFTLTEHAREGGGLFNAPIDTATQTIRYTNIYTVTPSSVLPQVVISDVAPNRVPSFDTTGVLTDQFDGPSVVDQAWLGFPNAIIIVANGWAETKAPLQSGIFPYLPNITDK